MDNLETMEDVFISNIKINKVRHLENLEIPLSGEERKHLILTGKNGSGKTSVLLALKNLIDTYFIPGKNAVISNQDYIHENGKKIDNNFDLHTNCYFNDSLLLFQLFEHNLFLFAFFGASRLSQFSIPSGPKKLEIQDSYRLDEKANVSFMQHMANLRFNFLNAVFDQDDKTAESIDTWMDKFTSSLRKIFDDPNLKLNFETETFKYIISSKGKKFDLSTLSDGFSAAINIVTELMMRMEKQRSRFYDMQGIVLIDEIETHLHIDLQKKILPFLTSFFPKIQFIVTTHSPFVLTSIKDAVIYDLEHQEAIEDLSGYSVEAIIEGYFGSDKYSEALKTKVDEYEQLAKKDELSFSEEKRYQSLKKYFDDLSDVFAEELKLKIQQIRMLKPVK